MEAHTNALQKINFDAEYMRQRVLVGKTGHENNNVLLFCTVEGGRHIAVVVVK